MCASVNCFYIRWDSLGNGFNSWLTIFILIILVGFPITVGILYSRPAVFKLVYKRDEIFMNKFGSLIIGLNFHRLGPKVFIYLWATMIRKLWLALTLVFMQDYPNWCIQTVTIQTVITVIQVGYLKPFAN